MKYLPEGNRVQAGDIATPAIDARGKHVIIVGGGDTAADCLGTANRQGALSVTVLDHNPRPGSSAPAWSTRAGRRRRAAAASRRPTTRASTRPGRARSSRSSATTTGTCAAWWSRRSRSCASTAAASSARSPGRRPSCRPTWCCSRPASSAPTCPSCWTRSAPTPAPGRGTVGIDDRWQTTRRRRVRLRRRQPGASLVVWAIAEGRACAAAVDDALTGMSELPKPVRPHAAAL